MALPRLFGRLTLLAGTTIGCTLPHLLLRRRGLSPWPRRFLRRTARRAGFDVRIVGEPRLQDVFYVANHLSWVDILALGGATGCAFISKDNVARAPLVGWLAAMNNTIFIARERRGEVTRQVETVRAALATHQPIALFAEGGTGDGKTLRPFKPALFSVLLPPPRNIMIQPVRIDYGEAAPLVAWADGETGVSNARRILSARGRRTLTLHFLAPFSPDAYPDRKALAAEAHTRIDAAIKL